MAEEFRIIEDLHRWGAGGSTWPWRWRVERRVPAHVGRFLWWTYDVAEQWRSVTDWTDYMTCKAVIANGGELTRVSNA